jgi:hypothetical protein
VTGSVFFPDPAPAFEADVDDGVFFWVAVGSGVLARAQYTRYTGRSMDEVESARAMIR